jgi:hypothetical protein
MSYSAPQAHLKWQVPPGAAAPELSCEEALRAAYPGIAATFDAIVSLDDATESHNGDEFEMTQSLKERAVGFDAVRQLADARCARCSEGDDFALLISGMDDAMIAYADRVLGDDPVWSRLKALRQAMSESL